ncbi:hypothetical protein GWK47_037745 [Chionoecetes opilio]|uniref:DUF4745 domain-containing protein n=1 Tax=Chionoecetes opilio TaxID=41210 RepID=A0A8J4YER8_CHIOP|nr:hypothetical protein GWK47_037745 [Chionoecetes opilio]
MSCLCPQSLNTVCGTACRLSQCLAQAYGEDAGPGLVREVAEAWEGVARAVGVASAAVKSQMLVLVQEAQSSRQEVTASQADRRADLQRVVLTMLSAFLGLQQQFSVAVLERFSGVVSGLREEGLKQGAGLLCDLPASALHLLAPAGARDSPSLEDKTPGRPPSSGSSRSQTVWSGPASPGTSTLSPGTCHTLTPGSAWPPDAISRRWSMVDGWSNLGSFSLLASRRWSVPEADGEGGAAAGAGPWGTPTPTSRDSSVTRSPTHSRSTTPDPNRQSSFISNDELQDVIDLLSIPLTEPPPPTPTGKAGEGPRHSFDGGGGAGVGRNSFDGGGGGRNSIDSGGRNSFDSGLGSRNSFDIGGGSRNSFDGGGSGGRNSFDGGGGGRNSFDAGGGGGGGAISPVALSPTHHLHHQNPLPHPNHHPSIAQLFEEATKQQQQPPPIKPPQSPQQTQYRDQHQHQSSQQPLPYLHHLHHHPHHQQQQKQQQQQQHHSHHHPHHHHHPLPHHGSQSQPFSQLPASAPSTRCSLGEIVVEAPDGGSQVSTPLWPPSGIAPGVTLTECPGGSGEQESPLPPWTEGVGCERRGGGGVQARDSAHRASWPAAAPPPSLLWAGLEGLSTAGERQGGDDDGLAGGSSMSPCSPQYRRHSTDTTLLTPLHPHHKAVTSSTSATTAATTAATLPKTQSTDNISQVRAGGSCLDSNLQHLLLLNSLLPASSPPSPTSQYSLFTS